MITRRDFIKITAAGGALASMGQTADARKTVKAHLPSMDLAHEESRDIPVFTETDLVVVGGSSRAIAAAVAAARKGCRVFVVAPLSYLGDDICGSFLYERREEEKPEATLARKIFEERIYPTPLHVKTVLENELIDNHVDFLYSSYVTNAITGGNGEIAGVVIANRSGRQAIKCKAVIDATHTASVAGLFGASFSPYQSTEQEYQFTVVGNRKKEGNGIIKAEVFPKPFTFKGKEYPVTRYTFSHPAKEINYAALMEMEQKARTATWDPDQVDSSDLLWYIPGQSIQSVSRFNNETVSSIRHIPLSCFQPKGIRNLWAFSPSADIPRSLVARIMRPVPAIFLGELMGEEVANQIKDISMPQSMTVRQEKTEGFNYGRIGELLNPLRKIDKKGYIHSPAGSLPILGNYDVIVLGGGTAGAVAGLSSARHGAKTLVLEYLHGLGGLTTLGLIGRYWDGFREGFSYTIDKSVKDMAPTDHPRQLKNWEADTLPDWKIEWYRKEILKAKGDIWYGVLGCGTLIEGNQVKGIVVATPFGRGIILSKVLIDSTGSADMAIAAGASYDYTGKKTLAVQGAGMGKMDPGDYYVNNDWLFTDDTDILDISRTYVQAKAKIQGHYDMVKLPQTRERRRVVGEHIVSVYDILNHRRYPDTISFHQSSFDTHGMVVDPYFLLSPPMERHTIYNADVPLRSLLPKGLEGILTTGLGASAHRDAMPVIRMQPCLQNQGYAVGYLSALAVKENKSLRKVDIKKVQRHLVEIGNLPERVLTDKEFKGFSNKEMRQAADQVTDNYKGLEVLLTDRKLCMQLISERINLTSSFDHKVIYASILCMLGDARHTSVLEEKIKQYSVWDKGWHYTGMHQFGMSHSYLDALITALGNAKIPSTLAVVLEKAELLEPEDYFSHFRAVAMATEAINDRKAIPTLANMLEKPGVRNYSISGYAAARNQTVPDMIDVSFRNKSLKELHLARALYLCGDKEGIGKEVLHRYAGGLQGHYARYANEILELK